VPACLQLLSAVAFLHDRWVMHRDLKLSNLLFTHQGQLKLCDYGLARYFQPWQEAYTPGVVTLWYRCVSVCLMCVWVCGCVCMCPVCGLVFAGGIAG
jgi:cyclin-dependent kinase 10